MPVSHEKAPRGTTTERQDVRGAGQDAGASPSTRADLRKQAGRCSYPVGVQFLSAQPPTALSPAGDPGPRPTPKSGDVAGRRSGELLSRLDALAATLASIDTAMAGRIWAPAAEGTALLDHVMWYVVQVDFANEETRVLLADVVLLALRGGLGDAEIACIEDCILPHLRAIEDQAKRVRAALTVAMARSAHGSGTMGLDGDYSQAMEAFSGRDRELGRALDELEQATAALNAAASHDGGSTHPLLSRLVELVDPAD